VTTRSRTPGPRRARRPLPPPGHWSRDCLAGGVVGAIGLLRLVALASLIYAGRLEGYLPAGLTLLLLGAVPLLALGAWSSSHPGTVLAPQDVPCVVLAAIASGLLTGMPRATGFFTLVAALILSGFLTGLTLWLLGRIRGGILVRWVPLPAVVGLLVGIGALMLLGALNLAAAAQASWRDLRPLLAADALLKWLPALGYGVLLLVLARRWPRWWLTPVALLGGAGIFYGVMILSGGGIAAARAAGWLLGPFDALAPRFPLPWDGLFGADWGALARQGWSLLLVPAATVAAMLVNTAALQRLAEAEASAGPGPAAARRSPAPVAISAAHPRPAGGADRATMPARLRRDSARPAASARRSRPASRLRRAGGPSAPGCRRGSGRAATASAPSRTPTGSAPRPG
jgi:MFS superfamily sulfate permease-like transporter